MEREKLIGLVQSAQRGNRDAMDALFTAFYNDVYYFALKTVGDQDLACDITQETFVTIVGSIGTLKEPAAFVTWMKQVAFSQCTRYFRKKKEVLVEENEDGETVFDIVAEDRTEFIPDEAVDREDFRATIMAMVDQLSEEQRAAVMLYYYDELSVKQIASIQGVSEGTVKSRLNYGRKTIRAAVEDYEKKNNVRLHSVALLPMLYWIFAGGIKKMPAAAVQKAAAAVAATSVHTAAAGAGATAGAAAKTTAGVAAKATAGAAAKTVGGVAAGTAAKAAGTALVLKIAAGITAAAVVAGGIGFAVSKSNENKDRKDRKSSKDRSESSGWFSDEETKPDEQTGSQDETKPNVELQTVNCEGLLLDIDASYSIHGEGNGMYCGIVHDEYEDSWTQAIVEFRTYVNGGDDLYWRGNSQELAEHFCYDETRQTIGERNGISYICNTWDGYYESVEAYYAVRDRMWIVKVSVTEGWNSQETVTLEQAIDLATSARLENAKPDNGIQTVEMDGLTLDVDGGYRIDDHYDQDHGISCYEGDKLMLELRTGLMSEEWDRLETAQAMASRGRNDEANSAYYKQGSEYLSYDEKPYAYNLFANEEKVWVVGYYLVGDQWWTITAYSELTWADWYEEIDLVTSAKLPEIGDLDRQNQEQAANHPDYITLEYLMSLPVSPEVDFEVTDYREYDFGGYFTLTAYRGQEPVIVMPETVQGRPIEEINNYLFSNSSPIRGIRISDSVQVLDTGVFALNDDLQVVVFGKNIRAITDGMFQNCESLHTIVLNDGLESIGDIVFTGCDNLKEIEIPSSVTHIGAAAFFACNADLTIIGEAGSYAQQYAQEQGINFRAK